MGKKTNLKMMNQRVLIIAVLIIALTIATVTIITIKNRIDQSYEDLNQASLNIARSYTYSLNKASEAQAIIDQLLAEKLMTAGQRAVQDSLRSNSELAALALEFDIDEISIYDETGRLTNSNRTELIGWQAYLGHPVYDFMNSRKESMTEDIRQDTVSGDYYKFAYQRFPDGSFVQTGILANHVQSFYSTFEIQNMFEEIMVNNQVKEISFIDNEMMIISSTNTALIGQKLTDPQTVKALADDTEYGHLVKNEGINHYEALVPVYQSGFKIGTLSISQTTEETEALVRTYSVIGFVTLTIIVTALISIIVYTFRQSGRYYKLAYYDTLTGLPDKAYLMEFLAEKLAVEDDAKRAILLVNCSDFKRINLLFGYEKGDAAIRDIADRLHTLIGTDGIVHKFTADRFVVYLEGYKGTVDLINLAKAIQTAFRTPFIHEGYSILIEVMTGIVEKDQGTKSPDQLLRNATLALNNVRVGSKYSYAIYNEDMEKKIERDYSIEKELQNALTDNGRGIVYMEYQPMLDLATGKIAGFEALARMKSDTLGQISPMEFIKIAERKQLIVAVGKLLLREVCTFAKELQAEGYTDRKIAINASVIEILQEDYIDEVLRILQEYGIENSMLEIEITESEYTENYELLNHKLKQLKSLGFGIALDDFGTGYSSFSRLMRLNISSIKIDISFISTISDPGEKILITGNIIKLGHKLKLKVVAEGVENQVQMDYLKEHGCDYIQGYYFCRPLSAERALQLLKDEADA